MKDNLLYSAVALGIVAALISLIYGAILPYSRSQAYIEASRNLSKIRTVQDFRDAFNPSLNSATPIGDEEIFKYLSSNVLGVVANEQQQEAVSLEVLTYLEPYAHQTNVRHLLAMMQGYSYMWAYHKDEQYVKKAEEYLLKAYEIGPKLPPVLYAMLDFYQMKGDQNRVREVAKEVLSIWPEDQKAKDLAK